ncbi:MAG: lipoprotein insertase outer membrane protein LolB [Mariprofundus sp.]
MISAAGAKKLLPACLAAMLLLAACATPMTPALMQAASSIGPYSLFSGRLIVIEPSRRWQVQIDWNAPTADQGRLRLTHAASNTIIEFRWQGVSMRVRDNHNSNWRAISADQLAEHGIVLPPQQLARILKGKMPATFQQTGPGQWQSNDHSVRLHWHNDSQRLVMTDIKHGRKATLIIQ